MLQFETEMTEISDNIANQFKLTVCRRILIKIHAITYILEFVLICRLMNDIILHASFNSLNINYVLNSSKDRRLIFNHIASILCVFVLIFEVCRLISTNHWFASVQVNLTKEKLKE